MKGFGALLRKQVRVWSLGVQEGPEYDSASSLVPSSKQHECVEIFPAGGFIYITDDIFDSRPRQALDIIKLFIAKIQKLRPTKDPESPWQEADNIDLHWRLCVRPELMEYLFDKCEEKAKALEAGDSDALARAELYTLLSDTDYIEQDSPISPLSLKADKFPIMSERRIVAKEEPVDYFNSLARSREKANLRMIRYYAGLHIDMRRDYRLFYIVHTDPFGAPSKQWQQEYGTITDILTPEKCIVELSKEGDDKGRLFDFYERYLVLPQDESVTATHGKQVTRVQTEEVMESQASPESDEIRPTL
jgi:chromo domain-containing protein 1